MSEEQTGHCLCGAVKVRLTAAHNEVGACHCAMCRRWGSGPLLALRVGHDVAFDSTETIREYRSSDWAVRAFCSNCGSHLYYKLTDSGEISLSAGLLDASDALTLTGQVFFDEKPEFYTLANDTPKLTGAEAFALYAPKDEG